MKYYSSPLEAPGMRRVLLIACVVALSLALTIALLQPARADDLTTPPVPDGLQVDAGHRLFRVGHAIGTQDYRCLPAGASFAWSTPSRPQATLFDVEGEQVMTHFLSPNPDESGTPRATWQDSRDTSAIWAFAVASSLDSAFVAPGAIPWLKLQVAGSQDGPTGGDRLSGTTFIQRLNTSGGITPSTGCASANDVGKRAFVPYTADYYFYKATGTK